MSFKLPGPDEFLTEDETAAMLSFSVAKLRGYRRRREIGCTVIGRHILHSGRHIQEFARSNRHASAECEAMCVFLRAQQNRSYLRRRKGLLKSGARPLWADGEAIRDVYVKAALLTDATGVPHEVDHIIPLAGKNVCGLHVHANLRAITASENRTKGSRFS